MLITKSWSPNAADMVKRRGRKIRAGYYAGLSQKEIEAIKTEISKRDFYAFVKTFWNVVEPAVAFCDGLHIKAICEHLQAVYDGRIRKLLIAIPPRHGKTLIVSVLFTAWMLLRRPELKILSVSYSDRLVVKDSLLVLRLLTSPNFVRDYGRSFGLRRITQKEIYTSRGGYRMCTTVDGGLTGFGADVLIVDDPINAIDVQYEKRREQVNRWYTESLSTRLDNQDTGVKIVIAQRLHNSDLIGMLMDNEEYDKLILPAESTGINQCVSSIDYMDRRPLGKTLWDKYSVDTLAGIKKEIGEYAYETQYQQAPRTREDNPIKVDRVKLLKAVQESDVVQAVRYYDKAATKGAGCYTVGVLMYRMRSGRYVIADVISGQWDIADREDKIYSTAVADNMGKIRVETGVEEEPGSAGKESAENTMRRLAGFVTFSDRVSGAKEVRAEPFIVQVSAGNVDVIEDSWTQNYLRKLAEYPASGTKDFIDATSGAFNRLVKSNVQPMIYKTVISREI